METTLSAPQIKRALISTSDKKGVVAFARALQQGGVEILSTGGTACLLSEAGISVIEVKEVIEFPEILDGRVKTLHPKIHAALLARRDKASHMETLARYGIDAIDLLCVNLYPFEETINKANVTLEEAIENIDIGGPTMIRAAAKNWRSVSVLTDPEDYHEFLNHWRESAGLLSNKYRFYLAGKAFAHTARYDRLISDYWRRVDDQGHERKDTIFPQEINLMFKKREDLRYGENPHQQAAFYQDESRPIGGIADYQQLQGKPLSYNNIMDADAAWEIGKIFDQPSCAIVKHSNPCGVATARDALHAYENALATDPKSAFGGVIAFNCELDKSTAHKVISKQFVEVLVAPRFSKQALEVLAEKKNIRLLCLPLSKEHNVFELKRVGGGVLIQTGDHHALKMDHWQVVTARKPSAEELNDLQFLWKVVKFVKSNAVIFGKHGRTYGIGAGQMSRVDASFMATKKAQEANLSLQGACAASDAFFPFRDGLDLLAQEGIKAVIQPGGSIRDKEVIQAANEHDMAMIFTGVRHFRH